MRLDRRGIRFRQAAAPRRSPIDSRVFAASSNVCRRGIGGDHPLQQPVHLTHGPLLDAVHDGQPRPRLRVARGRRAPPPRRPPGLRGSGRAGPGHRPSGSRGRERRRGGPRVCAASRPRPGPGPRRIAPAGCAPRPARRPRPARPPRRPPTAAASRSAPARSSSARATRASSSWAAGRVGLEPDARVGFGLVVPAELQADPAQGQCHRRGEAGRGADGGAKRVVGLAVAAEARRGSGPARSARRRSGGSWARTFWKTATASSFFPAAARRKPALTSASAGRLRRGSGSGPLASTAPPR